MYTRDGEPMTLGSLSDPLVDFSDPLVVSETVRKNGNEHLRSEQKFICLRCGIEDLLFAVHTK